MRTILTAISVVIVSHAEPRANSQRLYSPVFERRRHVVDRFSDEEEETGEDRFGWTYDVDDEDDVNHARPKDDFKDDPVPRRDLTQCLQETLIASTSNLSGTYTIKPF